MVGDIVDSTVEGVLVGGRFIVNMIGEGALVSSWKSDCFDELNPSSLIDAAKAIAINIKLPMRNVVAKTIVHLIIGVDSITQRGIQLFLEP